MHQLEAVQSYPTAAGPEKSGRKSSVLAAPFTLLFLGVPVWWVLGLFQAAFFVAAAVMAIYLMRRRDIKVPKGFGVWLLFLFWLIGGLFVLQVDAPSAVAGGSSTRYLTYSYRFGWYAICTIVALYVLNTRRHLTSEQICSAIAWFFVILVGGGLLGMIKPFNFSSALEHVLPNSVTRHPFVYDFIHPSTAQIHEFLGAPTPRPSAPFAYTNEWGMAVAIALPFFVLVWWRRKHIWRGAMVLVLAVSAIPIVGSLNRGLWLAIAGLVLFVAIRSALVGRVRRLIGILTLIVVAVTVAPITPVGDLVQTRLDTPHSDEGRANLSTQAVQSTLEGSPVIGFGSTRDVAGNFGSIAGGATNECPKCEPPPLGTHGQAWLLIFASGFGGFLLFAAFLAGQLIRGFRLTSATSPATVGSLVVLLVTMPFYNALGVPLFIGFVSVGLIARDVGNGSGSALTLAHLTRPVRQGIGIVLAVAILGGISGLAVHQWRGEPVRATQAVLVPAVDLVSVPSARPFTLDSEALLVRSGPVVAAISEATGNEDLSDVSNRIIVGAEPNTRVLTISYVDVDEEVAAAAVRAAVGEYIVERSALHTAAYDLASGALATQSQVLSDTVRAIEDITAQVGSDRSRSTGRTLGWLRTQISATQGQMQSLDAGSEIGRAVSAVRIHRSSDRLLVRLGSGLTLGATAGLVMAWCLGGRVTRTSRSVGQGDVDGLPIVATASATGEYDPEVRRTIRQYLPLCGLLADPDSADAVNFADRHSALLDRAALQDGDRALLVVSERARTNSAVRLRSWCERAGMRPVGVIVVTCAKHTEGVLSK